MRAFPVAMALALLAGPVYAQAINLVPQDKRLTNEEIERNKQIDEEYKASIKKIPDQKPNNDPWGSVRGSGASQATAAKTGQPKPAPQKTTQQKTTKPQ